MANYHDEYLSLVGAKINAAKGDLMSNGLRDARGFAETAQRIYKSAENMYFSLGNEVYEPVNSMFEAFSTRPGLNDVSNVAGVDIVDINIQATQKSVMGYLSVERSMDKPQDIAWYQTLRALNATGGYAVGDIVYSPFQPISKNLNLGAVTATGTATAGAAAADNEINLGKLLVKKCVTLTAYKTGETDPIAVGSDLKGDGVIYWDRSGVCDKASVNYETGKITIYNMAANTDVTTITAIANIERTAEADGSSTLKTKPDTTTIQLIAKPNRIILENSFEDNAYMNKQAFNLSNIGVQMDFGRRAINQLLKTFVFYLDLTTVTATANAAFGQAASNELDLTDYLISSSEASTKNDIINQYILKLNKTMQDKTGRGPTCYLVDGNGAIVLGNNPMYFQGNPTFDMNLDGVVGTYRGLPVIRHHALNGVFDDSTKSYGVIIGVHKDPSGQAAPTIYGEYLPPYSIVPALNYDNPAQFSQALLSMSTTQELIPELCAYMKVLVSEVE